MIKHPKELGFTLGLKIRIGEPALITERSESSKLSDVVYVALLDEQGRSFEKGDVLKIGETGGTLAARWARTAGIFGGKKIRPNEMGDRRKWLDAANGKEMSVWVKKRENTKFPTPKGFHRAIFLCGGRNKNSWISITNRK
jgi:hypothetical protein